MCDCTTRYDVAKKTIRFVLKTLCNPLNENATEKVSDIRFNQFKHPAHTVALTHICHIESAENFNCPEKFIIFSAHPLMNAKNRRE